MKKIILIFLMIFAMILLSLNVSALINSTIFSQSDYTGDTSCLNTNIINSSRWCVNVSVAVNTTQVVINVSIGNVYSFDGGFNEKLYKEKLSHEIAHALCWKWHKDLYWQ